MNTVQSIAIADHALPETMRTFRAFKMDGSNEHAKFVMRCMRESRSPAAHVFIATPDPRDAYVIVNYTRGMITRASKKMWDAAEARRVKRRPSYTISSCS
jgi:hypothetical protein